MFLLSNIGTQYFEELVAMLPAGLFADFDGFHTSDVSDYTMKPHPKVFESFMATFNADNAFGDVIFVDDSADNVRAATKGGMTGIVYKSAPQIQEALRWLGLPISERPQYEWSIDESGPRAKLTWRQLSAA